MRKRFFISLIFISFMLSFNVIAQDKTVLNKKTFPLAFKKAVEKISYDKLGKETGKITVKSIDKNTLHVKISFSPDKTVYQNDWQLNITPAFTPVFHWSPHLTPSDNHIVDQHVFRSPTLIMADEKQMFALIPDLNPNPEDIGNRNE